MRRIFIFITLILSAASQVVFAQVAASPVLRAYATSETVYINKLSDNGLWAVASNVDANNSTLENYPYLFNVQTGSVLSLLSEDEKLSSPDCGARDVTDDGKLIVGSYQGKPAICRIAADDTYKWEHLPLPASIPNAGGYVTAISPDGVYMVGTLHNNSGNLDGGYEEYPVMWKNGQVVELPGIPTGKNGYRLSRIIAKR